MKIKTNKFKFTRKNSPSIKTDKKVHPHPHYSKIINSIFNQIKEKDKNKDKKERENGVNHSNNNKKIFILKAKKFKDLFTTSAHSTINYHSNINQNDDKINKKNHKDNNNIKNILSKEGKNSEKKIKIKKFYDDYKNNNDEKKQIKNNIETNIKNLSFKFNQENNMKNVNDYKITTKMKNNNLISLLNNKDSKNNKEHKSLKINKKRNQNNILKKRKKFYLSDFNNSEIFIKKDNKYNKKIHRRNNDNIKNINKTPLYNLQYKNIYKINLNNNINKTIISQNETKKEIYLEKNNFFSKNKSNKILNINSKDNTKDLYLSNKSLNNSCNSVALDSKRKRSLSKKRNEKKLLIIKQNEMFNEKSNKKIYNLYSYMNEEKKDININGNHSPSLKLIDIIRSNKKLHYKNLYVNNSD